MTVQDVSRVVTICKRGRTGLYADDLGLSVRGSKLGGARFAWAEIDCFADGCKSDDSDYWVLVIVLRTGQRVPVDCTQESGGAVPETLAAIRQVACHHEIPADLTGIPMTDDERPVRPGLYEDPGGQGGLRYWDGTQWSPLLPPHLGKAARLWDRTPRKSAGFWSDLPVADGRWNYAAVRARRATVWSAWAAAVAAASLGIMLAVPDQAVVCATTRPAAVLAFGVGLLAWGERWFYRKLDEASRASVEPER